MSPSRYTKKKKKRSSEKKYAENVCKLGLKKHFLQIFPGHVFYSFGVYAPCPDHMFKQLTVTYLVCYVFVLLAGCVLFSFCPLSFALIYKRVVVILLFTWLVALRAYL